MATTGLIFAFAALLGWTFGDWLLQKSARLVGDFKTILYVSLMGTIGLLPFVADEIISFIKIPTALLLLILTGVMIFFSTFFDVEALKKGKIAVIEPIFGLELPITVAFSILFWNERPSLIQYILIGGAGIGIILAVTEHHTHIHYHKRILEKGVLLAGLGAIVMGVVNFLIGISAQTTSPLMAIWFTSGVITVLCIIYLAVTRQKINILSDFKKYPRIIIGTAILTNAAWIFFAFAATLIPISLATTISESYIALVVLLGLFVNKEKLKWHQLAGIALAIINILLLSWLAK